MLSRIFRLTREIGFVLQGTKLFAQLDGNESKCAFPLDLEPALLAPQTHYLPLNAAGVPVKIFATAGEQYVPSRVSSYALAHYNRFVLKGSEESLAIFLNMADWLMQSPDGIWHYNFAFGSNQPPWVSCIGQGHGISVLVAAYKHTGKGAYLEQALRACAPYSRTVHDGGVLSAIEPYGAFFEEYPIDPPSHVLNGCMCALIGLLALSEHEPSVRSSTHLDEVLETTAAGWRSWDIGFWSTYDLTKSPTGARNAASIVYHHLHSTGMRYLGRRTGDARFSAAADKWQADYNSLLHRFNAFYYKVKFRIEQPAPTA